MGNPRPNFFVYLLQCRDKSLYCGYTSNLKERVRLHNEGKASKYARARRPVKLVYFEEKKSRQAAMKREAEIKKMNAREKQVLAFGKL